MLSVIFQMVPEVPVRRIFLVFSAVFTDEILNKKVKIMKH
ncbi:hypothetical protein N598_22630 [Klebsiella pneumoniae 303K]|nr:hypothetical protein N598_22630 [Klebsiella pneumoniae 303K]